MKRLQGKKLAAASAPRKASDRPALILLTGGADAAPTTPAATMRHAETVRFLAEQDVDECGIRAGDLIAAPTDQGARIFRQLSIAPGKLVSLIKRRALVEIDDTWRPVA